MDINRALSATDPQAAQNYTLFSYKERVFKKDELVDQMVIHFSMDGCLLKIGEKEHDDQEDSVAAKKMEEQEAIKRSMVDEGMPSEMTEEVKLKSLRN